MTAAIVILSIALAAAIGGLIALTVMVSRRGSDLVTARDSLQAEERRGDELEAQRDAALIDAATYRIERDDALIRLVEAEVTRNEASKREAEHAADQIRTAPDAVAAANELLQAARDRRATTDSAATQGRGDGETAAVPAAVAPGGPALGRRP